MTQHRLAPEESTSLHHDFEVLAELFKRVERKVRAITGHPGYFDAATEPAKADA